MKGEVTLTHPILINGASVKTLTYDSDEITAIQFIDAETKKLTAGFNRGGNLAGAFEVDYSFHLYLGFAAIIAINPNIDYADLERIKGGDLKGVISVGRNFIMPKSEENSEENISGGQSETTPEFFIPPSDISNQND